MPKRRYWVYVACVCMCISVACIANNSIQEFGIDATGSVRSGGGLSACVCVRGERERVCVCEGGGGRERVCEGGRERECVCVSLCVCVCVPVNILFWAVIWLVIHFTSGVCVFSGERSKHI